MLRATVFAATAAAARDCASGTLAVSVSSPQQFTLLLALHHLLQSSSVGDLQKQVTEVGVVGQWAAAAQQLVLEASRPLHKPRPSPRDSRNLDCSSTLC